MYDVHVKNNIAQVGLDRLKFENYQITENLNKASVIILRSYNLHGIEIPETVEVIGRAGAGVNNIPVEKMSERGVPVFNTPGANANAVKELTIAALLIAARNICDARDYVQSLDANENNLKKLIENGKKQFAGIELPGRTLGVIGLGSIGVNVANAALALGMKVIGFDPKVTVENAWKLSSGVQQVESLKEIFEISDAVTVHVPLVEETENLIDINNLDLLKKNSVLINFSREGIVNSKDVVRALNNNILKNYVCDFPEPILMENKKVIALPHLGASTFEAEENCAIMVIENIKDYIENGNINFSVNFPDAVMSRKKASRITIANKNIPNMVGQITTYLASAKLNIEDLLNKSNGNLAYTIIDLDKNVSDEVINQINSIEGVIKVRNLGKR
ncbi:MAG TPA: phosphoglycerate dehydrogenase [Woeseiaceae bacterium]|nr:phosphoglycerate dehydrogenase [Woeseiaceae bacterium]|tara:strand:+ start:4633 stop:5805 length:1173 start_codon:yes stop_codon:yes gene_type:complete